MDVTSICSVSGNWHAKIGAIYSPIVCWVLLASGRVVGMVAADKNLRIASGIEGFDGYEPLYDMEIGPRSGPDGLLVT